MADKFLKLTNDYGCKYYDILAKFMWQYLNQIKSKFQIIILLSRSTKVLFHCLAFLKLNKWL